MKIEIRKKQPSDSDWVRKLLFSGNVDFVISRGRKLFPADLSGFCAVKSFDERVGLATYEIIDDQCELVTLDAVNKFSGIGTALTSAVVEIARNADCKRLWLITINDNLDAIRFYQKRGFRFAAVHVDALEESRKLKPSIPTLGSFGIDMRDELEFEMLL